MTYYLFMKLCATLQAWLLLLQLVGAIEWPWLAIVMPTSAAITGTMIAAAAYRRRVKRYAAMMEGARK